MQFTGTIMGAVLGFMLSRGNLMGLLFGAIIGYSFDMRRTPKPHPIDRVRTSTALQSAFSRAVFLMMGRLAKADGPVKEQELDVARQVMTALRLNDAQRQEAMALFSEGKAPDFDGAPVLTALSKTIGARAALAHFFVELQLSLALVDGSLTPQEQRVLSDICRTLKISPLVFKALHARVSAQCAFQKFHAQQRRGNTSDALAQAYGILGVSDEASDAEVKRAYRKRMSEHHPDKLIANGLPPEMEQIAKEKSQDIQQAYSLIRKHRQH